MGDRWPLRLGLRCEEVMGRLNRYLDGELSSLSARRVSRHLARCRRCGHEAEALAAIKAALARQGCGDLDPQVLVRLQEFARHLGAAPNPPPV
ncbi:MAG: zf-HC2 domain-containing protein [Acidimicrobiales bacterium]